MPLRGINIHENKTPDMSEMANLVALAYEGVSSFPDTASIQNASRYITAYEHDKLVGLLIMDGETPEERSINGLCVHPSYQGIGIGRKLVERTIALYGHATISVETAGENFAFFEKCGFTHQPDDNVLTFCRHIATPEQMSGQFVA